MATKKMGILLSTPPENNNQATVIGLANEAVRQGIETYLYLIDDGVYYLGRPETDALVKAGTRLFVCAHGASQRGIPLNTLQNATFGGLVSLSNLIKGCDRFISFN